MYAPYNGATAIMKGSLSMKMSPMLSALLNNTTTTPATTTTTQPSVIETTAVVATTTTTPTTTEATVDINYDCGAGFFQSFAEAGSINRQVRSANNEVKRDRNASLKVSKLMYEKEINEAKYNRRIRDIEIRDNASVRIADNKKKGREAKSNLSGLAQYF